MKSEEGERHGERVRRETWRASNERDMERE